MTESGGGWLGAAVGPAGGLRWARQRRRQSGVDSVVTPSGAPGLDFDALAKDLAQGVSRRQILLRLAGAVVAGLGAELLGRSVLAPTPAAAAAPSPCSSSQALSCLGQAQSALADALAACHPESFDQGSLAYWLSGDRCLGAAALGYQQDRAQCLGPGSGCSAGSECSHDLCCPTGAEGCGAVCCAAGQSCANGQCSGSTGGGTGVSCVGGLMVCSGACVDLQSDRHNCGSCGHQCMAGEGCCSGVCTLLNTGSHCGACGRSCPANSTCVGGQCQCNTGYSPCGQGPVACCGASQTCVRTGICVAGSRACLDPGSGAVCSGDAACCSPGRCLSSHCWLPSGSACQSPGQCWGTYCTNGICCIPPGTGVPCSGDLDCCSPGRCLSGHCWLPSGSSCHSPGQCWVTYCTNGVCCIPPGSGVPCSGDADCCSPGQCRSGYCWLPSGSACQSPGQCWVTYCTNGVCCLPPGTGVPCSGSGDCCSPGQCTMASGSATGYCLLPDGSSCQSPGQCQLGYCTNGTCACPAGETNCSGTCVKTQADPNHCGTCGHACPSGQTCSNGQCACPSGQTLCSGACVNTQTDPNNCGGCGTRCGTAIRPGFCQGGKCGPPPSR